MDSARAQELLRAAEAWPQRLMAELAGKDPSGAFVRAVSDCTRAIEADPDSARGYRARGAVRMRWAEHCRRAELPADPVLRAAIADADAACARAPRDVEALFLRAELRRLDAAERFRRGEDAADASALAVADYGEILEADAARADVLLARARARLDWGEFALGQGVDARFLFQRAASDAGEAMERRPSELEATALRGRARSLEAHAWVGPVPVAAPEPASVPDDPVSLRRRREAAKLFEAAIGDLTAAVQRAPGRLEWLAWRACARAWSRDWNGALADFAAVERLDPALALATAAVRDRALAPLVAEKARAGGPEIVCACGSTQRLPARATGRLPRCTVCGTILGVSLKGAVPGEPGLFVRQGCLAESRLVLYRSAAPDGEDSGWRVAADAAHVGPFADFGPEDWEFLSLRVFLDAHPEAVAALRHPEGTWVRLAGGKVEEVRLPPGTPPS